MILQNTMMVIDIPAGKGGFNGQFQLILLPSHGALLRRGSISSRAMTCVSVSCPMAPWTHSAMAFIMGIAPAYKELFRHRPHPHVRWDAIQLILIKLSSSYGRLEIEGTDITAQFSWIDFTPLLIR